MANLIIKSSADNLVLQGSDASPAITVGATGTTTFAENMTLSGTANNLGTISSATNFPSGHIIKKTKLFGMTSDFGVTNSLTSTNWWPTSGANTTYTPDGGSANNSTIHCYVRCVCFAKQQTVHDGRLIARFKISGSNITNVDYTLGDFIGTYDYGGSGLWQGLTYVHALPPVTLDGNGNGALSFEFYHASQGSAHADQQWSVYANGTGQETHIEIVEVQ